MNIIQLTVSIFLIIPSLSWGMAIDQETQLKINDTLTNLHKKIEDRIEQHNLNPQDHVLYTYVRDKVLHKMQNGNASRYFHFLDPLQVVIDCMGEYVTTTGETLFTEDELLPELQLFCQYSSQLGLNNALESAATKGLAKIVKELSEKYPDIDGKKVAHNMAQRTHHNYSEGLLAKRHKARIEVTAYLLQHYCD